MAPTSPHARPSVIRGRMLLPDATRPAIDDLPDGLMEISPGGVITAMGPAPTGCTLPQTWPGAVILPGFVDAHVHFPQTRILGSASGPLLPWLNASVFPEEARFADDNYATEVAAEFTRALLSQGTVAAAVFSSSHPGATDTLFAALSQKNFNAQVGLTLMNRGAPAEVLLETEAAIAASEALIKKWHGANGGRLRFCVTPRFALSCDEAMLTEAGKLAKRHGLWVQTHISENLDEIRETARAFPDAKDYLDVYERFGLVGTRTILAHSIHLSASEWGRVQQRGAHIAHCPDSNFFLGSGCMPLASALERGVSVGLGTDVGAGRTFSLARVAASAYDASLTVGSGVSPETLLWLATRGGAQAIGMGERLGCLSPGFDADLIAIDIPPDRSLSALIDAVIFRHDRGPSRATMLKGEIAYHRVGISE